MPTTTRISRSTAGDPERPGETVDGDFNGSPELAGVEASQDWEGADVVEMMERTTSTTARDDQPQQDLLEEEVAARREVLLARTPDARALGLGELFERAAVLSASDQDGALVTDDRVLRERIAVLDAALSELEIAGVATAPRLETVEKPATACIGARPGAGEGVYDFVARHPWVPLLAAFVAGLWIRSHARRSRV